MDRIVHNDLRKCDSTHTLVSNVNTEQELVLKYQWDHYERTPVGNLVVYDSESSMMTFRAKCTKKVCEVFLYSDLDFLELKKQMKYIKVHGDIGCNEINARDNYGRTCSH